MNQYEGIKVQLTGRMGAPVALDAISVYLEAHPLEFTASWSPLDAATAYILDVSKDASFTPVQMLAGYDGMEIAGGSSDEQKVAVPDNGVLYYYRVRATNGIQTGGITRIISVPPCIAAPEAVDPVDVYLEGQEQKFTAAWRKVDGATAYRLDVYDDEKFSPGHAVEGYDGLEVKEIVCAVEVPSNAQPYYYRVRATNGTQVSEDSNTITVPEYS